MIHYIPTRLAYFKAKIAKNPWVVIAKCRDPLMWYVDLVGEEVLIYRVDRDGLWGREPAGHLNVIRFEDVNAL